MDSDNHATIIQKARAYENEYSGTALPELMLLSSNTVDSLAPYLLLESVEQGYPLKPWVGPFNQFEQVLYDTGSAVWQKNLHGIWLHLRLEDVYPDLVEAYYREGPGAVRSTFDELLDRLDALITGFRERTSATLLVSNFHSPLRLSFNIFDANQDQGLVYLISELNRRLASLCTRSADTHVFDLAGLVERLGREAWDDPRLYYMARMGFSQRVLRPLANRLVRSFAAARRTSAKVLVFDLDNTLWGGVLGDDGIEGIKIGGDYPGNIFADIQRAALALRAQGYLLAIASKNDRELVLQAFQEHPDMLLKEDDFSSIHCHWEPKTISLPHIADELNLGLDSFVFIDDNPVERNMVRSALPDVRVMELPPEPWNYLAALLNFPGLDRPRLSSEDLQRADMYQQEAKRTRTRSQVSSMEEFLSGLEMKATVGTMNRTTEERIFQLINKTNQFNLTTRRHSLDTLRRFAQQDSAEVFWLRLVDRFGELGLIAVGIVIEEQPQIWGIDTFLMSCRVMNREIESSFLAYVTSQLRNRGAKELRGYYSPTKRNHIVRDFYSEQGFDAVENRASGERVFRLVLAETQVPVWAGFIEQTTRPNVRKFHA
ncbi:MAG: HAD-IIIC family phosphatase [Pseudohongiellaceae bacterium]